jgi:hypothetical protein
MLVTIYLDKYVRQHVLSLIRTFLIRRKEDWYRISVEQLRTLKIHTTRDRNRRSKLFDKVATSFVYNVGLYRALLKTFPSEVWDRNAFRSRSKKSEQREIFLSLVQLLPQSFILENYYHPQLMELGYHYEFDVFIPTLNIAVEYQGEQHFHDVSLFTSSYSYQLRDRKKFSLSNAVDITLFSIPYWSDRSSASLFSLLYYFSPKFLL